MPTTSTGPICDNCGTDFLTRQAFRVNDSGIFCGNCINISCFSCNECGQIHKTKNNKFARHCLCNECIKTRFVACEKCNQPKSRSGALIDFDRNVICFDCSAIEKESHIQKSTSFQLTYNHKRHFGVEIECNRSDPKEVFFISPGFQGVRDGSLDSVFGEEHRSLILFGDKGIETIKNHLELLQKKEYFVDDRCGLHVHIDVTKNKLKDHEMLNLVSFMTSFDRVIFSLVPEKRRKKKHCRPLSIYISKAGVSAIKSSIGKDFRLLKNSGVPDYRYAGFNLQSYWRHGTVEFRYHQGTIDFENIYYWVLLCLHIVQKGSERFWKSKSIYKPTLLNLKRMLRFIQLPEPCAKYWLKKFEEFNKPVSIPPRLAADLQVDELFEALFVRNQRTAQRQAVMPPRPVPIIEYDSISPATY